MSAEEEPKLQIDAGWKAEAQAEKERLAKEAEAKAGERARAAEPPKADVKALIGMLASQAVMYLGALADPKSGRVVVDLNGAQFCIDLLQVLEDKTKGNLTDEEAEELRQVNTELRSRFVQISQLVARQAAAGGEAPPEAGVTPPA